jgi:hypothetical protein
MGMPFAMASSASQEQFSVARTAAGTSASNEIKKRPIGRFFGLCGGHPTGQGSSHHAQATYHTRIHFRRRRRRQRANAGNFIHNCQNANGSRIGLVRVCRFIAGRDLDKEAVGFRAEAMGQGQDKVVGLPEAIRGKTSRRSEELVLPLHLHDELKRFL